MNEGTPSGSEHNKPWAAVLKCPNAELYLFFYLFPETNHVPKEYNVLAILSLLFMAPTSLAPALARMYFYISTFRSMCAVLNMTVFCSSLTSWFPGMVLTYFLNDVGMVYYYYYYYYVSCHRLFSV
jgi:hypothetical protein